MVTFQQNFNFCRVKFTSNINADFCALSNSTLRLKIVELIVSTHLECVGQISSFAGKIIIDFQKCLLTAMEI